MNDNEITAIVGWPTEPQMVKYRAVAATAIAAERERRVGEGNMTIELPDGWRAVAVDFDPDGDDPRADVVTDAWLDAMTAFYAAVPEHQRGFAEWCCRLRAAITVLADRLPPSLGQAPDAG